MEDKIRNGGLFSMLKNLLEDYRNHEGTVKALINKGSSHSAFGIRHAERTV